nr:hypothetical protein [Nostoc sp. WHI]
MPLPKHEKAKVIIDDLVKILLEELEIRPLAKVAQEDLILGRQSS